MTLTIIEPHGDEPLAAFSARHRLDTGVAPTDVGPDWSATMLADSSIAPIPRAGAALPLTTSAASPCGRRSGAGRARWRSCRGALGT
jgi:hypothetical protein